MTIEEAKSILLKNTETGEVDYRAIKPVDYDLFKKVFKDNIVNEFEETFDTTKRRVLELILYGYRIKNLSESTGVIDPREILITIVVDDQKIRDRFGNDIRPFSVIFGKLVDKRFSTYFVKKDGTLSSTPVSLLSVGKFGIDPICFDQIYFDFDQKLLRFRLFTTHEACIEDLEQTKRELTEELIKIRDTLSEKINKSIESLQNL